MSRIALVVGIDYYPRPNGLSSCVYDATSVGELLEYNGDRQKTRNFDCKVMRAKSKESWLTWIGGAPDR